MDRLKESEAGRASSDGQGGRITLPPPEWTGPAKPERRVSARPPPLVRNDGDPAIEGAMRARLEAARATGDLITEREASRHLARRLASAGHGLDEAVVLARRVLELQDDAETRLELATWLEQMGDARAAAEALRPLASTRDADPAEAARVLVRVGVLQARAGDARAADQALLRAASLHAPEAIAAELRGMLAVWAPEVLSPADAAESYVEAASRRLGSGALDAQLEDLLRAFDIDRQSSVAVAALAAALVDRGKAPAGDEVWRAHAAALRPTDPRRAATVHARRRLQARAAGDAARALGAALDEGLDAQFEGDGAEALDDLLLRVGLLEPLAARLDHRASCVAGTERARLLEELARLLAGPLASPERAAAARVAALEADPTRDDAVVALRAHASTTRDATHLVEGLLRAVGEREGDTNVARAARAACARALATLAEDQLGDAALAMWAFDALGRLDARESGTAQAGIARNTARYRAIRERVALVRRDLELAKDLARVEPLRALAVLLRSMPDESDLLSGVLGELVALAPEERKWRPEAFRVAWRRGDHAEVARLAREQLAAAPSVGDGVQARTSLGAALRQMGDARAANDATRELLVEAPGHRAAVGVAWLNAVIAGDLATRGVAIERLSVSCSAPVRAVMLAVASETLGDAGDPTGARRAAEQGCQAEPASVRCVATLADVVCGAKDRTAAAALERGIHLVGARSAWCAGLAEALEALGEISHAVGWTQRYVAVRPGDQTGVDALLRRLVRARDGSRLADALAWVMSQPQPAAPLAGLVARALGDLVALDADRAVVLARRALDAFGPGDGQLRAAMLEVADTARDDAFAAVLLERALAVDFSDRRGDLLLALIRKRAALGDADGEVRALAQAMREGFRTEELVARVAALDGKKLGGDGEIARLEAKAERFPGGDPNKAAAALAWRELGAALWDRAGDRVGAVRAWLRAAKLAPSRGYVTLGIDLARFAGSRYALDCLSELIAKESDRARSGAIAVEAARAALALDEPARALELAGEALERNPTLADALEIAEHGAVASSRESDMSRLYESLGSRALGRFGRRAAHYRGARFFEQRGDAGLALKHAALAFCAVPSEGATFLLLKRIAERADDRAEAVRTVVQVADAAKTPGVRAGWLLRAAAIASTDEEGSRLKLDVLLRAVLLSPDLGTLSMLADAVRGLLRVAPEEREAVQVRLARATLSIAAKADGPEGSRVALALAELALDPFEDPDWALRALERAFQCDADLDEFAGLQPHAATLAKAEDMGPALVRLRGLCEKPYANVGVAALKLLAALAMAKGDREAHALFTVMAAERDPDDTTLLREADALAAGFQALAERFKKKVPDARRVEAFRALARDKALEGAFDDAIKALERASELADDAVRPEVEQEIAAAYESAGRAEEVEGRALRDATSSLLVAGVRASRWAQVAQHREARGDMVGAVDALLAAANLEPAPIERWSALERVAELARLEDVRVSAIREISARVAPEAQIAVLKRLARAYEARVDTNAAEAIWHGILEVDPSDEEADYALEALISARADYSDLANHLGRRAERLSQNSGTREALRAIRLRRAAILEQRLGRAEDACQELLSVLRESPDNASAMSYLADLYERMGEHARAIPLWARVGKLSRDPRAQSELELRAARAALTAREHEQALELARGVLEREPGRRDAQEVRVDAARALRDHRELGNALSELAASSTEPAGVRVDGLIEASREALRANDVRAALARAQRAARLTPERADAQLLARTLEYRVRGSGTPDDARRTIEELSHLPSGLAPDDAALRAFLVAEAFDAFQGRGAGLRVLLEQKEIVGPHPLLELGLAERRVAHYEFAEALPHFQAALQGELSTVRDRGRVAIAAAEAALRSDQVEAAERLLDDAGREPSSRAAALMRKAQLFASRGEPSRARDLLRELCGSSADEERVRALAQLGRMLFASDDPLDRDEADDTFDSAIRGAPVGSVLHSQLVAEREARGPKSARASARGERLLPSEVVTATPPPVAVTTELPESREAEVHPVAPPSMAAEELVSRAAATRPPEDELAPLERAVREADGPERRSAARLALARAHIARDTPAGAEVCLREGVADGGVEEGNLLAWLLAQHPERSGDLVKLRQRQVDLVPGDLGLLEMLRQAALADRNILQARAVEHVTRAFDAGAEAPVPPPLAAQREHPGMLALLTQWSTDRVGQALALVWESAHASLARDAATYGLTGATRVAPDGSSAIARVYEGAIQVLGVPRIPVVVRKKPGPFVAGVALVWPATAVITGPHLEDAPDLPYVLGQALAAALPPNALLLGLPLGEARSVWTSVLGAFGPPELGRSVSPASMALAETFWETIPTRTQRRLQELLAASSLDDFDAAIERARHSARRVGLFLAGDFGIAARAVVVEQLGPGSLPRSGADLAQLCRELPALADLLRLAVSPEYADARWLPVPPASQRGTMGGGRLGVP